MNPDGGIETQLVDSMNIEARVVGVLCEILFVEEASIDLDAVITEDLAPDSLDQMRLYMALEDEFQDTIPEEKMEALRTVRDIIKYIETK